MAAALDFFDALGAEGKKIAVLGDMLEVGERAREHHKKIVKFALSLRIDVFVFVGKEMSRAFNYLENNDEKKKNTAFVFESWDDQNIARAAEIVLTKISKGDTVLVKGSRSIALERLVEKISGAKGGTA
jgi:UDP-N-acetylmuramyl pentapeptide synthase